MENFERLNKIQLTLLKLAYLNILWILFTLLGAIVIGIGPATAAACSVIRQWLKGNDQMNIFPSFWKYYKETFKESILISVLYVIIGVILVVDFIYVPVWYGRIFFGFILFFFLISTVYIFPVMVHFDWDSIWLKVKMSFIIGFSYLQYTLLLFVVLGAVYVLIGQFYPGIVTFFGFSFLLYAMMWNAYQVFLRMEMDAQKNTIEENI